ncbi:MAG TPA: glutamine--fructose-6-phosphate aminotransferase, partial [Actinomycetes bacterium]|nr:glutamine--fructose-6-phosphate aminotransferase [Actinomycetes bacterium]
MTGSDAALAFLLDGLGRLEYRGYDSAGVALVDGDRVWVRRRAGKLAELVGAVGDAPQVSSGIGHTRWATHGGPTERNAHPHTDCTGALALVHNGIIENHVELGDELVSAGHELRSETDSEVLAHLVEEGMRGGADLVDAVRAALNRLEGSFAIAAVHAGDPDLIVAGRRSSPLVAGRTAGSGLVA